MAPFVWSMLLRALLSVTVPFFVFQGRIEVSVPTTCSQTLQPYPSPAEMMLHLHKINGIDVRSRGWRVGLQFHPPLLHYTGTEIVVESSGATVDPVGGMPRLLVKSYSVVRQWYEDTASKKMRKYGLEAQTAQVLVLFVNLCASPNATQLAIDYNKTVRALTGGGARPNFTDYVSSCSNGKLKIGNFTVVGPLRVSKPSNCSSSAAPSCSNIYPWRDEALAQAESRFNVSVADFDHYMVVLYPRTDCPWTGLGNFKCLGSCTLWVNGFSRTELNAYFHEFGHNLGLMHAVGSDGGEYSDLSCAMGGCCAIRCFNAAHNDMLGWRAPLRQLVKNATAAVCVSTSLKPSEFVTVNSDPNDVRLHYVAYKGAVSYDSYLRSPWVHAVFVNYIIKNEYKSYLEASLLDVGQKSSIAPYLNVTLIARAAKWENVTVRICY